MRWKRIYCIGPFFLITQPLLSASTEDENWYPQRDSAQVESVVMEFGPRLYKHARFHWGMLHHDAEDHVQNVFLKFIQFDEPFTGQEGVGIWLRKTSFQLTIDNLRKLRTIKRGGGFKRSFLLDICDVRERDGPEGSDFEEIVERFRSKLSAKCAEIILLREVEGLSTLSIAARLNLNQRLVQRLLCGALRQLHFLLYE